MTTVQVLPHPRLLKQFHLKRNTVLYMVKQLIKINRTLYVQRLSKVELRNPKFSPKFEAVDIDFFLC